MLPCSCLLKRAPHSPGRAAALGHGQTQPCLVWLQLAVAVHELLSCSLCCVQLLVLQRLLQGLLEIHSGLLVRLLCSCRQLQHAEPPTC